MRRFLRAPAALLVFSAAVLLLVPIPAAAGAEGPSPRKAFVLSLLVPGLGQVYGSGWEIASWSTARAVGYGAFETVAWIRQQDNLGRGLDKQTEYRAYADANWNWTEYACTVLYDGEGAIEDDPFALGDGGESDHFFDTEAEYLEFYEDIHKLQKWICGWNDYADERFYLSLSDEANNLWSTPMQRHYRSMRQEQNELMSTADHWLYAIVANHLVSAFDAYFTARQTSGRGDVSMLPALRIGETMVGDGPRVALAWRF